MIQDGVDFNSRSKQDPTKISLDGVTVGDDETEAMIFANSWNNGTPAGISTFLNKAKGK